MTRGTGHHEHYYTRDVSMLNVPYLRIVEEVTAAGFIQADLGRAVGASQRTVQNSAGGHTVLRTI